MWKTNSYDPCPTMLVVQAALFTFIDVVWCNSPQWGATSWLAARVQTSCEERGENTILQRVWLLKKKWEVRFCSTEQSSNELSPPDNSAYIIRTGCGSLLRLLWHFVGFLSQSEQQVNLWLCSRSQLHFLRRNIKKMASKRLRDKDLPDSFAAVSQREAPHKDKVDTAEIKNLEPLHHLTPFKCLVRTNPSF